MTFTLLLTYLKFKFMETKFTFSEEIAVSSSIVLRILDLKKDIEECKVLGVEYSTLTLCIDNLKSAYRKLTGVDFDSIYID